MRKILFLVVPFCFVVILVGGSMAFHSIGHIVEGIREQSWPQTTGRIESVESKDHSSSKSPGREILVRYAYSVEGRNYEGRTIHPAYNFASGEESHRRLESLLRKASAVRVHYDPGAPQHSTLAVGFFPRSLGSVVPGLMFFGTGLGLLLLFWLPFFRGRTFADGIVASIARK